MLEEICCEKCGEHLELEKELAKIRGRFTAVRSVPAEFREHWQREAGRAVGAYTRSAAEETQARAHAWAAFMDSSVRDVEWLLEIVDMLDKMGKELKKRC